MFVSAADAWTQVLHALQQWKTSVCKGHAFSIFRRDDLCELSTSCACLEIAKYDGVRLTELLAVLELVTRPGVPPEVLHSLLLQEGDVPFAECPLAGWCSYCDSGDGLLHVRVATCSSSSSGTTLENTLIDWDDATAPPRFQALRASVVEKLSHRNVTQCQRPPMQLTLEVGGRTEPDSASLTQELQAFLSRYKQAVNCETSPLFRIACLSVSTDDDEVISTIARSGVPPAISTDTNWMWTQAPSESAFTSEKEWRPSKTLLATGNFVRLRLCVPRPSDETRVQFNRLHELLHSQPLAIKELEFECMFSRFARATAAETAEREPFVRAMAHTLFASDSTLRPDRLVVCGVICEKDITKMIEHIADSPLLPAKRCFRYRELVCKAWSWPYHDSTGSMGRRLDELLHLIGGVESLRIPRCRDEYVSIVDVVEIRSCRRLDVSVASKTWHNAPPSTGDQVNASRPSPLQSLTLRLSGEDDGDAIEAVACLLSRMGRSLLALSLSPYDYSVSFGSETAQAIVRECPALEALDVGRCLTSSFVTQLVDSIAAAGSCRLKRLALQCAQPVETLSPLIAALASPRHPLSRSLRTLRLTIADPSYGDADVNLLFTAIGEMLDANDRLQHVVIQCVYTSVVDHARVFAVVPAPLRSRLALLSAVGRYALPEAALRAVFEIAGRRTRRLRFELLDANSLHEDSET
ncbi:hypothetical protein PINS_up003093 [Pythium insidiosum]|nr:hypothetical protein PINS_up003093 [Pythium insidiosum]